MTRCVCVHCVGRYADSSRESFKAPTRLECMMQDIAALVDADDAVGFTLFAPTE